MWFSDMRDRTLGNGLRVLCLRHGHGPLVEARCVVPRLVTTERDLFEAVLHSAAAANVRSGLPGDQEALLRSSVDLGGTASPWASVFSGVCQNQELALMLRHLAGAVIAPRITEIDVAREYDLLMAQFQTHASHPQNRVMEYLARAIHGGHPAALRRTATFFDPEADGYQRGTVPDVVLGPQEAVLILLVGSDADPDAAFETAESVFGEWDAPSTGWRAPQGPPLAPGEPIRYDLPGSPRSYLSLRAEAVPYSDDRYPALLTTMNALGGSSSSRLMRNLRGANGWVYGVSAALDFFPGHTHLAIEAETAREHTNDLLDGVRTQLAKMSNHPPDEEEFLAIKRYTNGSIRTRLTSQADITAALADLAVNGLDPLSLANFTDRLARVSHEEVVEASRTFLDPERFTGIIGADSSATEQTVPPATSATCPASEARDELTA